MYVYQVHCSRKCKVDWTCRAFPRRGWGHFFSSFSPPNHNKTTWKYTVFVCEILLKNIPCLLVFSCIGGVQLTLWRKRHTVSEGMSKWVGWLVSWLVGWVSRVVCLTHGTQEEDECFRSATSPCRWWTPSGWSATGCAPRRPSRTGPYPHEPAASSGQMCPSGTPKGEGGGEVWFNLLQIFRTVKVQRT